VRTVFPRRDGEPGDILPVTPKQNEPFALRNPTSLRLKISCFSLNFQLVKFHCHALVEFSLFYMEENFFGY
jgi:hypothetical protein